VVEAKPDDPKRLCPVVLGPLRQAMACRQRRAWGKTAAAPAQRPHPFVDGHAPMQRGERRVQACGVERLILHARADHEGRDSAPLLLPPLDQQQLDRLRDGALMTSPRV
jgi:hypothetical protein